MGGIKSKRTRQSQSVEKKRVTMGGIKSKQARRSTSDKTERVTTGGIKSKQAKQSQSVETERVTMGGIKSKQARQSPSVKTERMAIGGIKSKQATQSQSVETEKVTMGDTKSKQARQSVETTNLLGNRGETERLINEKSIKHNKLLVAAIDFGTTYSGYAFCTRSDYADGIQKIYVTPRTGLDGGMYLKAPTSVLLKPDKTLHSFGFEAERNYHDPEQEHQFDEYYFFRQFKMKLFKAPGLSKRTVIEDVRGKKLYATHVFSTVIKYFKEELLSYLQDHDTKSGFTNNDIHWVVTVPAIWDLKAKQFIRESANMVGIVDEQLTLALEPEAASLFCQKENVGFASTVEFQSFSPGLQYLVLDLGGGTIDITAHEMLTGGDLRELHHACGGYWGGSRVNEKFMSFISRLFGADVRKQVETIYPEQWLELTENFERKKKTYTHNDEKTVRIQLPPKFTEIYKEITECDLTDSILQSTFKGSVKVKSGKLSMEKRLFENFFEESINHTLEEVSRLLTTPNLKGVSTILMVGGYAESHLMSKAIRTKFSDKRIVIPQDASLAVLKGAVIYGFEPKAISSRVSRYTYGIAKQKRFNKYKDPQRKKRTYDGIDYCDDAFDKHVEIGEVVKVGKFQEEKEYEPTQYDMKEACLEFFASTDKNPRFVDDPSCTMVRSVIIPISESTSKSKGKIYVKINVGGTEIEIEAREEKTGKVTNAYCDFLP